MIRLLLSCAAFTFCSSAFAQLYMPRDVKQAFANGTRSADGRPGKKYWQNHGRYHISITAAPPSRTVKGTESITYFNESPDTLSSLVFRIIQNIHKPGAVRNGMASEAYLTPGVTIDGFTVNGVKVRWGNGSGTAQRVNLPQALLPKSSVQMTVDWHFDASLESGREGMIDSTTFFLAYFYPRVSVYDDYSGWDRMDFTDQQEFYNDFNDYQLTVNVPKNYIVWATGDLQNAGEVLQPEYAKRFETSLTSDAVIHVATAADLAGKKVTAQKEMNAWKWSYNNISDVALAFSDHFVWDAGSTIVDTATRRRASVQAAYNDTAADFREMVTYGKHALSWLSAKWPGVPYPFPKTTVVQGYAGMEYPMMANDETYGDPVFSRFVAEHEIAHSWFPFYMGINESRYAFMDEGWATAFEWLIGTEDLGKETANGFFKQFRVDGWVNNPSAEGDLPIITPANLLRNNAYGNNAYGKPALGYLALKDMLGDELFRKCLHGYMDRWHGKHPIPWDFFNSFNSISAQNLDWFWNSWFFTNYYPDLAATEIKTTGNAYALKVRNIGGLPVPFDVVVTYKDGTSATLHQSSMIWKANGKEALVKISSAKKIGKLYIDNGIWMDADESDNTLKP